jgi:hypothetical protein
VRCVAPPRSRKKSGLLNIDAKRQEPTLVPFSQVHTTSNPRFRQGKTPSGPRPTTAGKGVRFPVRSCGPGVVGSDTLLRGDDGPECPVPNWNYFATNFATNFERSVSVWWRSVARDWMGH